VKQNLYKNLAESHFFKEKQQKIEVYTAKYILRKYHSFSNKIYKEKVIPLFIKNSIFQGD
jgi:hypothetical protein